MLIKYILIKNTTSFECLKIILILLIITIKNNYNNEIFMNEQVIKILIVYAFVSY